MTRTLERYELTAAFHERFRPVKAEPRGRGLNAYRFDSYGLHFYRHLTTAAAVPEEAIWSIVICQGRMILVHGQAEPSLGHVVAQGVPAPGDPTTYPLPRRLGYRAKVAVQALQRLKLELSREAPLSDADQLLAVVERRIAAYHYPHAP